jgi:hypothetical protein
VGTTKQQAVATATPVPSLPPAAGGEKAVRIELRAINGTSGSFPSVPGGYAGTTGPSGWIATQLLRPDGTVLANSPASGSWPAWLSSFDISLSGPSNSNSTNGDCARFAAAGEDTSALCDFKKAGTPTVPCGASGGYYRISEYDCHLGSQGTPSGKIDDGVQLRAVFNRSAGALGANENILVVIEYSASALNPPVANPSQCFSGGVFAPEACTDIIWKAFLKTSPGQANAAPFLLFIPPALAYVEPSIGLNGSGGGGVSTKQFVLPLASNAALNTLQISRMVSTSTGMQTGAGTPFQKTCHPGGSGAANSANCAGAVFYSITFFRI